MISLLQEHFDSTEDPILPMGMTISESKFYPIDLSVSNRDLDTVDIKDPDTCQQFIDNILEKANAMVAYGGYLEKRNLYNDTSRFSKDGTVRNIHLGIDFWTSAGTEVIVPLAGRVHSFQNNRSIGDYGPTIILQHEVAGFKFYTLYGHLSLESIENLQIGQEFNRRDVLATLGTPDINVNYAPHLHFQIIIDMEGMNGNYPGVCSADKLKFYTKNCPNPNILLQMKG